MSGRDRFDTWAALPQVRVGVLVALTGDGTPLVVDAAWPEAPAYGARSVVDLRGDHIGAEVVVACEGGDPARPIVLGVLQGAPQRPGPLTVEGDGQRMVVSAQEQLVLRCGKASITLTREGKVLIDGAHVLSRASGMNRIKGGSVQVN